MPRRTGYFAENVVHFVRLLRAAGLPVGPERTLTALEAVQAVGVERREDLRGALGAVLVSRQEQQAFFDQAFDLFWRNPRFTERAMAALLPSVEGKAASEQQWAARLTQALVEPVRRREEQTRDTAETRFDAAFEFSPRDQLRHRDFETMTLEEVAVVRTMLAGLRLPLPERVIRRTVAAPRGHSIDLRAAMRAAVHGSGAMVRLPRRAHRRRRPPLVVLCDISGSMDRYSRMLMYFLHAITNDHDRVHVFLFGTRLTNVTRQLRHHDVDVALARVGRLAPDWAGGTRIGACLHTFNRRWSRRVLGQGAVVLLISDGLDADAGDAVAAEMERLAKSCGRVLWLNPLLRYEGFEPRASGVRAMLPYVDEFLPVHNLESLMQLAAAFDSITRPRQPTRRRRTDS